jgi:hypothetical protein
MKFEKEMDLEEKNFSPTSNRINLLLKEKVRLEYLVSELKS